MKTYYLVLTLALFSLSWACEQPPPIAPQLPPVEDQPISFSAPRIGQESMYRSWEALYDQSEGVDTVVYGQDTLWLEITGQSGHFYQMEARYTVTPVVEEYQFSIIDNKLVFEISPANLGSQRLLAERDVPVEYPLSSILNPEIPKNHQSYFLADCSSSPCLALKTNHVQMGKSYPQINVQSNFTAIANNGSGLYFFYNQGEGFVRIAYTSNWAAIEFGYDLIPE